MEEASRLQSLTCCMYIINEVCFRIMEISTTTKLPFSIRTIGPPFCSVLRSSALRHSTGASSSHFVPFFHDSSILQEKNKLTTAPLTMFLDFRFLDEENKDIKQFRTANINPVLWG